MGNERNNVNYRLFCDSIYSAIIVIFLSVLKCLVRNFCFRTFNEKAVFVGSLSKWTENTRPFSFTKRLCQSQTFITSMTSI